MKKLIVFDLDGTLAESKASLDAEMAALLSKLLGIVKVAVISGGNWPQFKKQVLSALPRNERLKNLSILPTCGTKFYRYEVSWKKLYSEDFTTDEKEEIIRSLQEVSDHSGFKAEKVWGEVIEDRGSQVTFSALGQEAPLNEKKKWDPDFAKRKKMKESLDELIPNFSVRLGGMTSIDVTKPGIDKAYGIRKLRDTLGIGIHEMIFVGDALFPGGNDYPAKKAGALSIQVKNPHESKRVIEAIAACLTDALPFKPPGGASPMSGFRLKRLGQIMEPEPGNPHEAEGVLNPAAVRGPDGQLYLFPRLVARGNFSRIGIARVKFNADGDPTGVERLGIALEPEADYECVPHGGGGCEDPRITFVEPLHRYVMTYTALSSIGPRIAVAISKDLFHWKRLGLAAFEPYYGIDFVHVDNKDASVFPVAIPNHAGKMQMGILHRPLFPGTRPEEKTCASASRAVDLDHESIWISYCPMPLEGGAQQHLGLFNSHHRLATPVSPWEMLKIGGGTTPILTRHGWLIVYHGVSEVAEPGSDAHYLCYSAGVMILSKEHPREIRYRSKEPVLTPRLREERSGIVPNVVFPTGIDRRDDLGMPDRFDVYYGMADSRIGVARIDLPEHLPPGAPADVVNQTSNISPPVKATSPK